MFDYKRKYNQYLDRFNEYYNKVFSNLSKNAPSLIKEAMCYATGNGGKRVRPVLLYAVLDFLGGDLNQADPFALALECIHSYSLVHDDLPAMDNDDYRRGKLSTHKKFGEAYGILAGDALLNFAFELCLAKDDFSIKDAKCLKILADCSGYSGMIGGQVLDLQNEKNLNFTKDILFSIYENKTGKLLTAPLLIASTLADGKYFNELKDYGYNLGCLFQIVDDIMDVTGTLISIGKTPNKDTESGKLTSIKIFGYDGAKKLASEYYNNCLSICTKINDNGFLTQFSHTMYDRKS